MRVTAFIGAGAALEIGGPTSGALTTVVRARKQWANPGSRPVIEVGFLEDVTREVERYYQPQAVNFEDVFHAIEVLASLAMGLHPNTHKKFKPVAGGFMQPADRRFFDTSLLMQAGESLVRGVAETVASYAAAFDQHGKDRWFSEFWRAAAARAPLDFATLNYDDCVERCLPAGSWEDGFEPASPGAPGRFDPRRLEPVAGISRMIHNHGCILYGYPRHADPNQFMFEDQHEDLYRYVTHTEAEKTWFGRSQNQAQAGEQAIAGPIITGLRKPDKLLAYPYSAYHDALHRAVLSNSRLLVAGYSFGDVHFNRVLERVTRLHGDNRRIVLVTYCPDPDLWHPGPMEWMSHDQFVFIAKAFQEAHPLGKSFTMPDPLISKDGCARVYLRGFRHAVEQHGDEILAFLTS